MGGGRRLLALLAATQIAHGLSALLRFSSEQQEVAWLPNGLVVAYLLHEPRRSWLLGLGLVAGLELLWRLVESPGQGPPWSVGFTLCNVADVLTATMLLRLAGRRWPMQWLTSPLGAVVTVGICLGSALIGSLVAGGMLVALHPGRSFAAEAQKWFLGDAIGMLLTLPLTQAWLYQPRRPDAPWMGRAGEVALVVLGLAMATNLLRLLAPLEVRPRLHGELMFWPLLTWAATRFDARGLTLVLTLALPLVCLEARSGEGQFAGSIARSTEAVVTVQSFLFAAELTALLLWASRERERRTSQRLVEQVQASSTLHERQRTIEWHLAASEQSRTVISLVAGLAHDLRNALGALRLQGDMLRRQPGDTASTIGHQIVDTVNHSLGVLASFVAISRQDNERPEPFDLHHALEQVVAMVRPALPPSIVLDARLGPGPGPELHGVSTEIQQVIINLLLNARDALEGHGHIDLSLVISADEATIAVVDQGRGIPAPVQEHIFDAFFTTKRHGVGTGLGLYVARTFVERHGGTIAVASRPGHGATFTVRLPLRPPPPPPSLRERGEESETFSTPSNLGDSEPRVPTLGSLPPPATQADAVHFSSPPERSEGGVGGGRSLWQRAAHDRPGLSAA